MVSNITWQELSNNYLLVIALVALYYLDVPLFHAAPVVLYVVLCSVLLFNFFVLSKGMQRQYILKQDAESFKQNRLLHFCKYWLLFRVIRPFLLFNTMSTIFRLLTASCRRYPDFYLLGPKRAGSTTLAQHLLSIGFKGPYTYWNGTDFTQDKETNYYSGFLGLSSRFSNHRVYKLHFPLSCLRRFKSEGQSKPLYFDADPAYFHLPHVRDRIYATNPDAKFLVMLRNPLQRVVSNFKYESTINEAWKSCGLRQDPTFKYRSLKEMIAIEQSEYIQSERQKLANLAPDEGLPESVNAVDRFSVIEQSSYQKTLHFWCARFERKQFYLIDLEKLNGRGLCDELKNICTFLEHDISESELMQQCKPIHVNKQSGTGQAVEVDEESMQYATQLLN